MGELYDMWILSPYDLFFLPKDMWMMEIGSWKLG